MTMSKKEVSALRFICIIILILGIGLISFGIFMLPYVLFDYQYDVPEFTLNLVTYMQNNYDFSRAVIYAISFLPFFIVGILMFWIARKITAIIETLELTESKSTKNIYYQTMTKQERIDQGIEVEKKKNPYTAIKYLIAVLFVLIILTLAEYIITSGLGDIF